jgi:hypothetical protein
MRSTASFTTHNIRGSVTVSRQVAADITQITDQSWWMMASGSICVVKVTGALAVIINKMSASSAILLKLLEF